MRFSICTEGEVTNIIKKINTGHMNSNICLFVVLSDNSYHTNEIILQIRSYERSYGANHP
jgi:hypothetical protein